MAKLVLVKHAPPQITPEVISNRWVLSEEGRRRCDWLADELTSQGVSTLYTSIQIQTSSRKRSRPLPSLRYGPVSRWNLVKTFTRTTEPALDSRDRMI